MTSWLACVIVATRAAASGADPQPGSWTVRNVTVVDVERGVAVPGRTVRIADGRIALVSAAGPGDVPEGSTVLDGTGLYLMPGLFDSHVHLTPSPETFGPMLVAGGVTCVRDTGAPTEMILGLREQARGGATLPEVVCTGAIVDGVPPIWPFSEACDEPEEARAAVRRLAGAGVDQIKVYERLAPDVYRAAIEEAHRAGLKVTGHVPQSVTLREAVAAGQDCVEHLTGFDRVIGELAGYTPPPDAGPFWPWFRAWSRYGEADPAGLGEFLGALSASGTHLCPTLVLMKSVASWREGAEKDPRMEYVPGSLVQAIWGPPRLTEFTRQAEAALPSMQALVGELHRAGVKLLVGTDLANAFVLAGFAVHEEMRLFQEAGIPAPDVLRAATIVPARFCGVEDTLGTVAEGKTASLVLLSADPLADVANASRIEGVFLRGRYFDRAALEALLASVRTAVAAEKPADVAVELDLPGEVVRRGRYRLRFEQFDAGTEEFLITKDAEGYHLQAHSRPQGGPMPPSLVTMHLGPAFEFRSAHWRVLTEGGIEAWYRLEGGKVEARARRGAEDLPPQSIDAPAPALISGPAWVMEFPRIAALRLGIGQSSSFEAVSFGYPSWEPALVSYTFTRHEDGTLTLSDGREVTAAQYASTIETPAGALRARAWTDASGMVLRRELRVPGGTISAELADPDE